MGAYICIGLSIVLIGICVFVAIGSMKTHSGGKFEEMAADFGEDWLENIKEGSNAIATERDLQKLREKQSSLKPPNEGKKDIKKNFIEYPL